MNEIAPGIRHWTAEHPNIGSQVSSYWLPAMGVLIDPLAVPDEVDAVDEILLSNRHHRRDAFRAHERFGAPVRVPRAGVHEFEPDDPIEPYDFGEPLAGGAVVPHQVSEVWPDDGALHIPPVGALALADSVIHYGDELEFVPDKLMGDAQAERAGLREGLARLAETLEFEHLLLAHGAPVVGDGRERLRAFTARR